MALDSIEAALGMPVSIVVAVPIEVEAALGAEFTTAMAEQGVKGDDVSVDMSENEDVSDVQMGGTEGGDERSKPFQNPAHGRASACGDTASVTIAAGGPSNQPGAA